MGEKDPMLAAPAPQPVGPASKRQPIPIVLEPDERPVTKDIPCGQPHGFNLQAATRVAANDKDGRSTCEGTML
jgi:hypothetical protein